MTSAARNFSLEPWARAFAGALIFSLPMLMTMEMWQIGFYIHPLKLALLLLVSLPLLYGLATMSGFEPLSSRGDAMVDTLVAIFVAAVMAASVLFLLGVISPGMPVREIVGKMALQTFAGGIGALLAGSQLHADTPAAESSARSYPATLLLMAIGAIFLGLNVAPTEEMVLLSYMMSPWQELGLVLLSLVLMHAFVYVANFRGRPQHAPDEGLLLIVLRYTVTGYAIVLLISLYLLWTFGRIEGTGFSEILGACAVLGFPCAIGAAASRLIL